jgi:hypothetical protein
MSMPSFYVPPEQAMKDRADYARKGIARGRSLAAVVYDEGILICAENHVSAELRNFLERAYPTLCFQDSTLFAAASHKERYGDAVKIPVKLGYSAGQGGTFSNAQANDNGTQRRAFLVTPNKAYGYEAVPNEQLIWTEGKEEAVIDILTDATKSATAACSEQAEISCFKSGFGDRGQIKSNTNPSGNLYDLVLFIASDCYNFSFGDVLVSKATLAAASLRTGTAKVTAVDAVNATIRVDGGGTWTPTNNDYLGLQGTMAASTTASDFIGLAGWLPDILNRPTSSDSFYGVNRFDNTVLLAGHAIDGRNKPILPTIRTLAGSIGQVSGAKPDLVLMNPSQVARCELELGTQSRWVKMGTDVDVYFDGISVMGPKGPMVITPAPKCPADHLYVLDSSVVTVGSPQNKPIMPASPSGDPVDSTDADKTQVRMRASFLFYLEAPGFCGNALITP